MGIPENILQLDKAMKTLLGHWREAGSVWHDPVSQQFEREHLEPLQLDLKKAVAAMDRVAKVVSAVRRDCD